MDEFKSNKHIQSEMARSLATLMLNGEFARRHEVILLDAGEVSNPDDEYDWLPASVKFLMPGALKISIEPTTPDDWVILKLEWIDPDNGEVFIHIGSTPLAIGQNAIWYSEDLYWPMKLE